MDIATTHRAITSLSSLDHFMTCRLLNPSGKEEQVPGPNLLWPFQTLLYVRYTTQCVYTSLLFPWSIFRRFPFAASSLI